MCASGTVPVARVSAAGWTDRRAGEDVMPGWLTQLAGYAVVAIHAMALVIILVGTIWAFLRSGHALLHPSADGRNFRDAYVQYGRWLVAGLTFQLAADIVETAVAPTWDEIRAPGSHRLDSHVPRLLPGARSRSGGAAREPPRGSSLTFLPSLG